jgi:beta-fructofuranosidase
LFYIRHNLWPNLDEDLNEKNLGHTWTTDFNSWSAPDTAALSVRPGKFDELHVWAPSIVQRGPTFWMFYTGVRNEGGHRHQRIGVATSTDLVTWTAGDSIALSAPQISWASKDPAAYSHEQQLRDPFVTEDPIHPGQWLMYFVAVDSVNSPHMAVGVARTIDGNFLRWAPDAQPLLSTERSTSLGTTGRVESPHVFHRKGYWYLPYSPNGEKVFFETNSRSDPADADPSHWSQPIKLQDVAEGRPAPLTYWHATEYLRIDDTEYLAAFDDNATSIDVRGMFQPSSPESAAADSFLLTCPELAGVGDRPASPHDVCLRVSTARPGTLGLEAISQTTA